MNKKEIRGIFSDWTEVNPATSKGVYKDNKKRMTEP